MKSVHFGKVIVVCTLAVFLCSGSALGGVVVSANFATYADGELVGQNGWSQYNTQAGNPLTVSNGAVSFPGGVVANNQDAMLSFGSVFSQPADGAATVILNFDLLLSVSSAGSNPSYFAALNQLDTTTTGGNFQNARLVARSEQDGFVFGARVNGQSGYPFAYGTEKLNFDQEYALRAEIHMVGGNQNDFIRLLVGSDFNNLSLHSEANYTSGTVTDPTFGAMLISQFGNTTTTQAGVSIKFMSVTAVPEPSGLTFLALASVAGFGFRRRR
jgi:MYXO-CTERM domain-containing protein